MHQTHEHVLLVATVLTACGIETIWLRDWTFSCSISLQQCLPLAVLKHLVPDDKEHHSSLQQCLPLAVLKQLTLQRNLTKLYRVATVLTACGIETFISFLLFIKNFMCCNSAYRLRYWNLSSSYFRPLLLQQPVATVLTACGIETPW